MGGNSHIITDSDNTFIFGGVCNCTCCCASNTNTGGIIGGCCNRIICNGSGSTILGGFDNRINALYSHIIGSGSSYINSGAHYSLIAGAVNAGVTASVGSSMGNNGSIAATTHYSYFDTINKQGGSFNIAHPDPSKNSTHRLVHTFVESPTEGDNLYRYEIEVVNGVATLELPSYFKWLNKNVQMKISPKNHFGIALGILDSNMEYVNFTANQDGKYNVLIMGTRKDTIAIERWRGVEVLKPLS
jgi:hypothetical protein